jgi:hypothetical protein
MSKGRTKMKMVPSVEIVTFRELERTEKHTRIYAEVIKSYLEELHPKLPAYFCNSGSYVWPLCLDGDIDRFLERNRAKRIDAEGEVDKDVLVAIHNIIKNDKYRKLKKDDIVYLVVALKEELSDPQSELSQALAKATGSS